MINTRGFSAVQAEDASIGCVQRGLQPAPCSGVGKGPRYARGTAGVPNSNGLKGRQST